MVTTYNDVTIQTTYDVVTIQTTQLCNVVFPFVQLLGLVTWRCHVVAIHSWAALVVGGQQQWWAVDNGGGWLMMAVGVGGHR